jgi:hypothetical protein
MGVQGVLGVSPQSTKPSAMLQSHSVVCFEASAYLQKPSIQEMLLHKDITHNILHTTTTAADTPTVTATTGESDINESSSYLHESQQALIDTGIVIISGKALEVRSALSYNA